MMTLQQKIECEIFGNRSLLNSGDLREMEAAQNRAFQRMLATNKYGVKYLGEKITVRRGVFPPRADSVVLAQSLAISANSHVLDVGTGSGVLSMIAAIRLGWGSSKKAKRGRIASTDVSSAAIENAKSNMKARFGALPKEHFHASTTSKVFPAHKELFDVIIANLPFRLKGPDQFANEPDLKAVQRTMWDVDFIAHETLMAEGVTWLKSGGHILLTVANYPDAVERMEILHRYNWKYDVVGLREWYPCDTADLFGLPLAVACLRLEPK